VQIRATCQGSRSAFAQLIKGPLCFKPRLLLVSSGNNKLMEMDPFTGELLRSVLVRKPAKRMAQRVVQGPGATGWYAFAHWAAVSARDLWLRCAQSAVAAAH
jgi:hypothetical protein